MCAHTFTARSGTAYHRLRRSPTEYDRAVQMSVEGSSKSAISRVSGISTSTVARWLERAATFARKWSDRTTRSVPAHEIQADEIRGYARERDARQYVFASIEVSARLWLSHSVGGRSRRNTRLLIQDSRARVAHGQRRVLITTDPFDYYRGEVQRAWGPTCLHVESSKIIKGGKIRRVRNTIVNGVQWQLDEIMSRSEDSRKPNTAYIERLNLFIRRSLPALHRRTNNAAKKREKLAEAIEILKCYYNFIRPHGSLKFGREYRTPAQQAGIVTKRLTFRDIFMAFRPMARVPWLKDPRARAEWRAACRPATVNG